MNKVMTACHSRTNVNGGSVTFNLESFLDITVFDSLVQRPVHEDLARLPPADELHCALANVPNNRAAGPSGVLPEMVKCAGPIFFEHFYSLICQVWQHGKVR